MTAQPSLLSRPICGAAQRHPGAQRECLCRRAPGHDPDQAHQCGWCAYEWPVEEEADDAPGR